MDGRMNMQNMYAPRLLGQNNAQNAYANGSQATLAESHWVTSREMTAEDLGLGDRWYIDFGAPVTFNGVDWVRLDPHAHLMKTNALYRQLVMGDAPCAFWLGADA